MASPPLDGGGDDDNHHSNGGAHHHARAPAAKKPKLSVSISSSPITAEEVAEEFSHHDPSVARINNGSFGSCPASIIALQTHHQHLFLRQPDHFYFHLLKPSILRSRLAVQSLINADHVDEISLVDNATTAAAIVLQRAAWAFSEGRFRPGDAVVLLHYAYGAVKKSIEAYVARSGGRVIEVPLPFPVRSPAEIVSEFRRALADGFSGGSRVRLAVIDHITSMPTVLVPVKELICICREAGVDQVFVDAAHAIGNVPIDVKDIGADIYTSNLYKWFFCPPSVAFLYCRRPPASAAENPDLHHPVVSHEYGNGLAIESAWIGTRDYSAQLVVAAAIDFMNRFEGGIDGVRKRNHERVVEMGIMLANAWGTHLGTPPEMCTSMIMVGLPSRLGISSEGDAMRLRTHLRMEFGVEVPIHYQARWREGDEGISDKDGRVSGYARISHQVYNRVEEYYKFRDAINRLVDEGFTCRKLQSQ